jgi:hypothetical protein
MIAVVIWVLHEFFFIPKYKETGKRTYLPVSFRSKILPLQLDLRLQHSVF